jgi:hypothetical protein
LNPYKILDAWLTFKSEIVEKWINFRFFLTNLVVDFGTDVRRLRPQDRVAFSTFQLRLTLARLAKSRQTWLEGEKRAPRKEREGGRVDKSGSDVDVAQSRDLSRTRVGPMTTHTHITPFSKKVGGCAN